MKVESLAVKCDAFTHAEKEIVSGFCTINLEYGVTTKKIELKRNVVLKK